MEQNSQRKSWKGRLAAFGPGVFALVIVYAVTISISNDVRLTYATGALLLFGFAFWLGRKWNTDWLDAILLCVPIFAVFARVSLVDRLWPLLRS